jgi:hypothetical protein
MKHRHWSHMLAIEQEIIKTSRYVELHKKNYKTFSTEFTKLILTICSEIDVTAKLLCKKIDNEKWKNITATLKKNEKPDMKIWRQFMQGTIPSISTLTITIPSHNLDLTPWENLNEEYPISWWYEHNLLKHRRDKNYKFGNLKNVLVAFAALISILLYFYGTERSLVLGENNKTRLFEFPGEFSVGGINWSTSMLIIPEKFQH